MVFWVAAVGRATANNYLTREQYLNVLGQVFSNSPAEKRAVRQGLNLCIGLAPEWFALAMLLWDLILSDSPTPNGKGNQT